MNNCLDHLDYTESTCPDCGHAVDRYGNTEGQFDYCSFPDCGCNGARLCMAKGAASDRAVRQNVEDMWRGKTIEQRRAVFELYGDVLKEGKS
jgi:hypothetical protein